jgi:hypothetical protein
MSTGNYSSIYIKFPATNYCRHSPSCSSTIVTNRRIMSDSELDNRLIGNLRRARLAFEEVDLQLEELVAKCDELIRQQKLQRIKQKQKN